MINVSTVYSAAATTTNKNKALNSSLKTTNHDYRNILPSVFKGEWSNVSNEIIILLFICLTIASLLSLLAFYCLLQCLWRKYIDKNNDQMFENNSLTATTIEGRRKFKRSFSLMPSESITLNRQSLAKFDHKKRRKLFSLSPTLPPTMKTTLRKRNQNHSHNLTNVEITLKMPNDRMRQLKREQTPIMRMIQLTNANRRQLINLGYNDVELESIGYYRVNIFKGQSYRQQLSDWNDSSNVTSGFNVTSENSKQQQPFIHRKNRSEREITYTSSEFESDHSIKDKKL